MSKKKKRHPAPTVWIHPTVIQRVVYGDEWMCDFSGHLFLVEEVGYQRVPISTRIVEMDLARYMTVSQLVEVSMSRLRRIPEEERQENEPIGFSDPEFESEYAAVAEYMFTERYPDGSPRKPSSLTLFIGDGKLKCVLKDSDNHQAMWASGDSFKDLLETLELLLDDPRSVWRVDRTDASGPASRKKR